MSADRDGGTISCRRKIRPPGHMLGEMPRIAHEEYLFPGLFTVAGIDEARKGGLDFSYHSRQDKENIHIMFSDHLHFWHRAQVLLRPKHPWEFIELGNCGSPMETDAGWLVLSHGVGAMRKSRFLQSCLERRQGGPASCGSLTEVDPAGLLLKYFLCY